MSFRNTVTYGKRRANKGAHLTLGILRTFQAVFYAFSFSWLDGFAVPAPARVTQTVGHLREKQDFDQMQEKSIFK